MDVDLLRPGTVPIAPETILWFEFLLDKDLLLKHLAKEYADPSPSDLIVKFYSVIGELYKIEKKPEENNEGPPGHNENLTPPKQISSLKVVALKLLALKVAAFLNWNLNILCTLPTKIQINLIQDLLQFTNSKWADNENNIYQFSKEVSKHHVFALILYHRWVIKICFEQMNMKNYPKYPNNEIVPTESIMYAPETIEKSLKFLMDALNWEETPNFISYNSFIMPTEINAEIEFDWDKTVTIPREEFLAQIHYDLATYNFYKENYLIAIPYFTNTMKCINDIQKTIGFLNVKNLHLEGFLIASNSKNGHKYNLTKQLKISIVSHFVGLLNIFVQDNIDKEISLVHRINVEINIRSALSCGKFTVARDLLPKVQALNAIRFVIDNYHILNLDMNNLELLSWSIMKIWNTLKNDDKNKIKSFIMEYFIKNKSNVCALKEADDLRNLLDECMLESIMNCTEESDIPSMLQRNDWDFYELNVTRNPYLEIKLLEERIISSYNPDELRELLVKLTIKDNCVNITKINTKWELPIPLQSVIMAIPRGFLQDFGYILLAKSKELMLAKDWNLSINLLNILYSEVQNNQTSTTTKLARLIKLEILLVQMNELIESWPALHLDRKALYHDCESCLKMNESVLPRSEIIEQCIMCLINLNHWDFVTNPDKLWNNFEIAIALAAACQELIKYKCVKKSIKDLWDLILPIFMVPTQTKRTNSGTQTVIHRDTLQSNAKLRLLSLFHKLRDSTALIVIISLLAKLYNILKDEASLELYIEYMTLWPAVISNANSYSEINVLETLTKLVLQALQYYPANISFLRLMGDINFANLNFDGAINYYLKYILVSTDYFNMPIRSDDNLFRRLIKCCVSLNCHTQAAIFCQFLDDPDYMQAFRSLSEQKPCFDTVDGYYHCFWDVNILEFLIYHHHKRTELKRKKHAIHTIGLLELNASNNEEIQHEASNIRKKTFLQAMCRQFISF